MSQLQHNLNNLARSTGFTKRQIRFYITKKLIPGAGNNRGPNAVYPKETLSRLLRIGELKQHRVPPTGRRLTLEEIRHELDNREPVQRVVETRPWELDQLSDHLLSPPRHGSMETPRLMDRLHNLLTELAADHSLTVPPDSGQWHRISIPDIEINVRQPDGPVGRARLLGLAESLQKLLNTEARGRRDLFE